MTFREKLDAFLFGAAKVLDIGNVLRLPRRRLLRTNISKYYNKTLEDIIKDSNKTLEDIIAENNKALQSDWDAIRKDFETVGKDMEKAFNFIKKKS